MLQLEKQKVTVEKQKSVDSSKKSRMKISKIMSFESHREYLDMDTDEEEFGHEEILESQVEAPPEPYEPELTDNELDTLVQHAKDLTVLPGLSSESSWTESCLELIREYFRDSKYTVLTIYLSGEELRALLDFPDSSDDGLVYIIRTAGQIYRPGDNLKFGSVAGGVVNTIFKFVSGLYAPLVFKSDWSDSILHFVTCISGYTNILNMSAYVVIIKLFKLQILTKCHSVMKDKIFSNINDFLMQAMDATYKPMGMFILYIPWEVNLLKDVKQYSAKERESIISTKYETEQQSLINRLEKVTRMWIKQIQEALMILPNFTCQSYDITSEYEFWQSRYEILSCISIQLKNQQIVLIIEQLRNLRLWCINDFQTVVAKVGKALNDAVSNLIYLEIVLENCQIFTQPSQIYDCMPRILHIIRYIWNESSHYNVSRNVERLLCSLSSYVVEVCINSIDLKLMFNDLRVCQEIVQTTLTCCEIYSQIYDSIVRNCESSSDNWRVNKTIVFKCIEAFEQRCRDVCEICDVMKIYGSSNKINFGSTNGNYYETQYRRIKNDFIEIMNNMEISSDYTLNIMELKWFQDMSNFRCEVDQLENTMKNLLNNLFQDVVSVDMGIEMLYTLFQLKERPSFNNILRNKWMEVWEMFSEEIRDCSEESTEYEIYQDQVKL
ncbi:PREDICTED: dynein-1-beta heavy chain, flagellar inner arm I1 complex [Ceratosolen solmsi marchali]|uniref:Dynein-1-beta heavy chain, flagellar inner arm I1 complex n=1 Tax=Ceratosolen solmsi marchali TaxID=326594 RepID=A0AAJ6VKV3_9HYME|nr:PREDICTED: dynein-1-beta heavy chain, flagellar inner arm I1 complex [Ceratosolen solmsi marchali]